MTVVLTTGIAGALLRMSEDPPPLSGMQSDSVGRSLIAVLKRDPRRFSEVTGKLLGRQLPAPLRSYMWMDVLLKAERQRLPKGWVCLPCLGYFEKVLSSNYSK